MQCDLRDQLIEILAQAQDMTLATVRPDGWPQATTVSFVADKDLIYFGCSADSQKARNIARETRVSLTVNLPYQTWSQIRGVSMAGRAFRVTDAQELQRVGALFMAKFPMITQYVGSEPGELAMFRIEPEVASILDYRDGFGAHELIPLSAVAA